MIEIITLEQARKLTTTPQADLTILDVRTPEEFAQGHLQKAHNLDFYEEDFSKYDFLFCNPDSPIERMLEKKLLKEMKGRLIVYGSQFIPKKLFRESEFKISGTDIFVFINCNDKKEL